MSEKPAVSMGCTATRSLRVTWLYRQLAASCSAALGFKHQPQRPYLGGHFRAFLLVVCGRAIGKSEENQRPHNDRDSDEKLHPPVAQSNHQQGEKNGLVVVVALYVPREGGVAAERKKVRGGDLLHRPLCTPSSGEAPLESRPVPVTSTRDCV